jgi:predicted ATPase
MGERGENFAALVNTISRDPTTKDAYLSWLRQLRPAEVDDVGTLTGAVGEPLFMLKEHGRTEPFPATVLSDGTLRFAAITAAFFQPDMPGIMTIEEIENGIHASRVRLLVELLRSRAAAGAVQLMASTHSPIVLAWLSEAEYATTFFCKRDEDSGESRICSLPQVPHFMDVVRKQPIADLFSEGWLESAL